MFVRLGLDLCSLLLELPGQLRDGCLQLINCLLQPRAGTAHHFRLVPKSAVRQTNSNESNAVDRTLFRRVDIADIRPVVDTSLAVDSLPNTEVAITRDVEAGAISQGRVVVASDIELQRTFTDARVLDASGVALERSITISHVVEAFSVLEERLETDGDVAASGDVVKKRTSTDGRVIATIDGEVAADVVKKRERSNSVIAYARAIAQKRARTKGRILISSVGKECARTNTCTEAATAQAQERIQADSSIVCAGGETKKGILPFCGVASGITTIRRRTDRWRCLEKREAESHERNEKQSAGKRTVTDLED